MNKAIQAVLVGWLVILMSAAQTGTAEALLLVIAPNMPPSINVVEFRDEDGQVFDRAGPLPVSRVLTAVVEYKDWDLEEPIYIKACFTGPEGEACWNQDVFDNLNFDTSTGRITIELDLAIKLNETETYSYYFETSDGRDTARFHKSQVEVREPSNNSNVIFIPGFQASRLYRKGAIGADRLWEPNNHNEDAADLMMTKAGESVNAGIYTRDVIDESFGFNIYKNFIKFMDKEMVEAGVINEWRAAAYDWRYGVDEVAAGLVNDVSELAGMAQNGRVTIVAHSNGGLVAKALLIYLAEEKAAGNSDLIDKVDRLIMVAVPQAGTPKALAGLLHGDEQNLARGLLLTKSLARELAENMPGAYSLLPSRKYFETVADPVMQFTDEVKRIYDFRAIYGESVDTWEEMQKFLRGDDGARGEPGAKDIDQPNVLNEAILADIGDLSGELDAWQAPAGLEVIQIAGWGLSTIYGIRYDKCDFCLFGQDLSNLDRKAMQTVDGDGTVVAGSAIANGGQTYYLNFDMSNSRKFVNQSHASIMEVESVQQLLNNMLSDNLQNLPEYISVTAPEPDDNEDYRLRMKSPVAISAYDSGGLRTGLKDDLDSDSDLRLYEEQIPNSSYFEFGEQKYLNLDGEDEYEIRLEGEDAGVFTLEIEKVKGDEVVETMLFKNIPVAEGVTGSVMLNTGNEPELKVYLDDDGVVDYTVRANESLPIKASIGLLRQEIKNLKTRRFNKRFLLRRLRQAEKYIKRDRARWANYTFQVMDRYIERRVDRRWGIAQEDALPLREIIASIRESL